MTLEELKRWTDLQLRCPLQLPPRGEATTQDVNRPGVQWRLGSAGRRAHRSQQVGHVAPRDELLTVGQAGEYLGKRERFIRRLVAGRRISYVKIGKFIRLQRSALDAFIEAGRVPSE
ncbi:helix-turn-helix domain-containing protein [Geodermatophilus sp. SYSU D00691]